MSYEQAPYWLWPLDRWKLLLTIMLALLLLLLAAIKQPPLEAVTAPVIQNPSPDQNFIEGEPVTFSGIAGAEQIVRILLCPVDAADLPKCDEESVYPLAETSTDASGNWQATAPPLAPGGHAIVAATAPDVSGQTWTSSTTTFQILPASAAVTAPSFDSPDRGTLLSQPIELKGQAGPGNAVFLFADTAFLGRTYANGKGLWRFETPELDVGTHFLVAKVLAPDGEALGVSEPLVVLVVPES